MNPEGETRIGCIFAALITIIIVLSMLFSCNARATTTNDTPANLEADIVENVIVNVR